MGYAGRLCPKCGKGLNNESPIEGHKELKKRQKKRYSGNLPCNDCLLKITKA